MEGPLHARWIYLLVIVIIQLEKSYRILSLLVLGTVLIVIPLVFTRLRTKGTLKKTHRKTADTSTRRP